MLVPRGGPFGHAREDERLSLNRLLVQKGVALGVTIVNVDRPPVPQPRQHCQPRQAGYRPVQRVPCPRHPAPCICARQGTRKTLCLEFLMTSTLTKLPFVHVSGLR
ncbi:uncharacterized protein LOC115308367 [Ixodes scapularis]|uniref:uncharacterized protein LOC115308367 n=1 Tax=Ixodes scapularis TaxID=6945 RepID=UPI001A9D80EC|nr:uncharacterized protein LOC115308367 [Ixodes scapularis]